MVAKTYAELCGAIVLISHDRAFLRYVTNRGQLNSIGRVYDYRTYTNTFSFEGRGNKR